MKTYTNELSHITNMAALPIYGKNFKKSSPEPLDENVCVWPVYSGERFRASGPSCLSAQPDYV